MKRIVVVCCALFCFSIPKVFGSYSHEVSIEIVANNADSMRALTLGAFEYSYKVNQTYWLGVSGFAGTAVIDSASGLRAENGDFIWGSAPLFYFNVPALLGATQEKPEGAQCHLYTSVGLGFIDVGGESSLMGILGGGLLWETGIDWLGVRFDLKGIFYSLENANGSNFNSDLALSIGPSFLF